MAITEREKAIAVLQKERKTALHDNVWAFDYAISSLKTDLKYDLMYEGEEVYTKADMAAMLTALQLECEEKAIDLCDPGWYLTYNDIIQQKINGLRGEAE